MTNLLQSVAVALIATWWPVALPPAHEFHITYGRLAIEDQVAVARIRFFRDDLELALAARSGDTELEMAADPTVDSLFLAYLAEHFRVEVGDRVLAGHIIGSGDDVLDREPAWWYLVRFDADAPIGDFRVRNTLLFDLFEDQQNMLTVVRFPEDTQRAYTFSAGEEVFDVRF